MQPMNRRTFIKTTVAAATCSVLGMRISLGEAATKSRVVVVHGKDLAKMLERGITELGGWATLVKKGHRVTLKPNCGWATTVEQGANTHPDLVRACIQSCLATGAAHVSLPEVPCSKFANAIAMNGIGEAAKQAGGRLYQPGAEDFIQVSFPQGRSLKVADVAKDVMDCDCLINMPVAKNHGGATLTLSMKNWMGVISDRGYWHRNNLHQCIADFSTVVKPALTVIDASRIMLTHGPRGPGKMDYPEQIILSRDFVAADAYAATLFKLKPFDVQHIQIANEMGLGCGNLDQVDLQHINI